MTFLAVPKGVTVTDWTCTSITFAPEGGEGVSGHADEVRGLRGFRTVTYVSDIIMKAGSGALRIITEPFKMIFET